MNRINGIKKVRALLKAKQVTIGSWIQLPSDSVAEVMGDAGYDWVAVDLEHGAISPADLPAIFRALELGNTLPLVRLAEGTPQNCKQALDAGSAGVIVPMVESAEHLEKVRSACCWPPSGSRGVGFSRANLFGKYFEQYREEAQAPLLVAMIEHINAVKDLENILAVDGLDALLIGPYDLSASLGVTAEFENSKFTDSLETILSLASKHNIPCGIHVVEPDPSLLKKRIHEGYRFIPYSIDSVFLDHAAARPTL